MVDSWIAIFCAQLVDFQRFLLLELALHKFNQSCWLIRLPMDGKPKQTPALMQAGISLSRDQYSDNKKRFTVSWIVKLKQMHLISHVSISMY